MQNAPRTLDSTTPTPARNNSGLSLASLLALILAALLLLSACGTSEATSAGTSPPSSQPAATQPGADLSDLDGDWVLDILDDDGVVIRRGQSGPEDVDLERGPEIGDYLMARNAAHMSISGGVINISGCNVSPSTNLNADGTLAFEAPDAMTLMACGWLLNGVDNAVFRLTSWTTIDGALVLTSDDGSTSFTYLRADDVARSDFDAAEGAWVLSRVIRDIDGAELPQISNSFEVIDGEIAEARCAGLESGDAPAGTDGAVEEPSEAVPSDTEVACTAHFAIDLADSSSWAILDGQLMFFNETSTAAKVYIPA